ncbi:MAG: iron ABC transporter permease [Desulfuromonas sp.]|nr:iron ABC transporter permease [Desulfuromonas sp.]
MVRAQADIASGVTLQQRQEVRLRKEQWVFFVLVMLLLAVMQMSLLLGKYPISADEYLAFAKLYVTGHGAEAAQRFSTLYSVLVEIRLPRIIAASIIGAALAVAGSTFQAMFVNPLVSPGLLGVLAGASFGAALGMVLRLPWFGIQLAAFVCGALAVALALLIAMIYKNSRSVIILILGGVISSSLFTALLSVLKYTADPYDTLPAIVYWLMGSLSFCDSATVGLLFGPMLAALIGLLLLAKQLNALSLGDEEARALGVNVRRIKVIAITLATLISALCVVMAGVIGWIGLIIPHIARMLFGADNRKVLPASALIGAIFLLVTDNLSRTLFINEVPIGILTSLVGIPIFVLVLKNAREGFK